MRAQWRRLTPANRKLITCKLPLADYLPKLEREANESGPVHDAEFLRELVIHQFTLVARVCMAVCASVEEFEAELRSDIARFVCCGLTQYGWLAEPMLQELETGFTFFVMGMNPWAEIPEADRGPNGTLAPSPEKHSRTHR